VNQDSHLRGHQKRELRKRRRRHAKKRHGPQLISTIKYIWKGGNSNSEKPPSGEKSRGGGGKGKKKGTEREVQSIDKVCVEKKPELAISRVGARYASENRRICKRGRKEKKPGQEGWKAQLKVAN